MHRQDRSGNDSLDQLSARNGSVFLLNQLSEAVSLGDTNAQLVLFDSLAKTPSCFQPAVPTLLNWMVSGDDQLRQCASNLICARTHWINPRDLDEFFVPAIVTAVPKFEDKWQGDLLMSAALSVGPDLSPGGVASLAQAADLQFRNEAGDLLSISASMGLLAERTPIERSMPVVTGIRLELNQHRTSLMQGIEDEVDSHPEKRHMFRVFLNSLFAQRNVIGARFSSGKIIPWGEELVRECRYIIHTMRHLVEQEKYPQWAAEYQMLFTSAVVDPVSDPASREALKAIGCVLASPLPNISGIINRLLNRESFTKKLQETLEDFDPEDVEQTIFFITALMDTIVRLERGTSDVGEARALLLYEDLRSVASRVTDPLVAYFASELRRVLRRTWPELLNTSE